ncbi:MAG: ankyrin repeat domain-containing protein, partial [Betaproteobacteria bacterium]|nr:ankyrin repeat domain-containing protein [Betaproteobacteria bacterium]
MSERQEDELDQQPVTVGTRSAPLDWKDGLLAFAASVVSFTVFLLLAAIAILAVFFLLRVAALLLPGIDPWARLLFGAFGSEGGLLLVIILLPLMMLGLQLPHYWWKSLAFERDRLIVYRRWFRPLEIPYADGIRIDKLSRWQAVLAYFWPYRYSPVSFVHPSVSVSGYHALRWSENVALFIPDSEQRVARVAERVNSRYGSHYTPRKWRRTLKKNAYALLAIAGLTLIFSAPLHFLSEDADGGLAYLDSPAIVRLYLAKEQHDHPELLARYLKQALHPGLLGTAAALVEIGANVGRIDQQESLIGIVAERFLPRVPPPPAGMPDRIRGERRAEEALAFIDLLLAHGARIDGDARSVPLHKAVEQRNADLARALLKRGAEVNETDRHGRTALFVAAASGNLGLVTLLLEAGADPRWQDDLDVTPMHIAAAPRARVLVIEALLKRGAPADAADYAGETPLIAALGTGAPGAR